MEYLNHPLKFIFSTVSQTGSRENCEGSYFCMNKQDGGIGGAIHRRETMMSIKVCLERQSYEIIWIIQVIIRDHRWLNDPPPQFLMIIIILENEKAKWKNVECFWNANGDNLWWKLPQTNKKNGRKRRRRKMGVAHLETWERMREDEG